MDAAVAMVTISMAAMVTAIYAACTATILVEEGRKPRTYSRPHPPSTSQIPVVSVILVQTASKIHASLVSAVASLASSVAVSPARSELTSMWLRCWSVCKTVTFLNT